MAISYNDYNVTHVPVHLIIRGDNDRTVFDERKLEELASDIRINGLVQPPTFRPIGGNFEIVAGERRTRAMRDVLGWQTIPAIIRELDDSQAATIMLIENVSREDLDVIDEAQAYRKRIEQGLTESKLGEIIGRSESYVRSRLILLDLIEDAQLLIRSGNLPIGFAEILADLDVNRQRIAVRWINRQKGVPTKRTFSEYAGKLLEEQNQESLFDISLFSSVQIDDAVVEANGRLCDLLPIMDGLPAVSDMNVPAGKAIDLYVAKLIEHGHEYEARVIINMWAQLQKGNYLRLSAYESDTIKRFGEQLIG